MKLKLALAATIGLLAGILGGGYVSFATSQWFAGVLFSSQLETRFIDHVVLLKLLDEGKIESARQMLLSNVQSDTIVVGSIDLPDFPDAAIGATRRRLLRFARQSGELKAVREDTTELGQEAAATRKRIPPEG